ncbi:MAG TPA: ABC transporter substrate-binding protein, partial [Kofleriaceae bacterium]|nr:ABC transporter substrate-binding protein [Kofleriaceae bacterium]
MKRISTALACLALALAPACGKKHEEEKSKGGGGEQGEGPAAKAAPGVDLAGKKVKIGTLNDESGPAAVVGKPFANGKRLLAAVVNGGGDAFLPDGWKIELVERDHGYNPMNAKKEFDGIKDQVLFIGTSFGTPNTLPLLKPLERDGLIAFPASLSSEMAKNMHTPPLGPSYEVEAMRAMDWAVAHAGGAGKVKAGLVYQDDDYGKDGRAGWQRAAAEHGVTIVSEHPIQPTDKDFTAVIKGLQQKGANYVLLALLPSASGPVLGGAA